MAEVVEQAEDSGYMKGLGRADRDRRSHMVNWKVWYQMSLYAAVTSRRTRPRSLHQVQILQDDVVAGIIIDDFPKLLLLEVFGQSLYKDR